MEQEYWTSRTKTITAFLASSIGLGNIWDLPSQITEQGGIIYLVFYILTSAIITFSFFIGLLGLGRMSRKSVISIFNKGFFGWRLLGYVILIVSILISSNYIISVGTVLRYVFWTVTGLYNPVNGVPFHEATTFYDYWHHFNSLDGTHLHGLTYIWDKIDAFLPFHSVTKTVSYAMYRINNLYSSNYHMTFHDFQLHYNNYITSKTHNIFSLPITYTILIVFICFLLLYKHVHFVLEKFFFLSVFISLLYLVALLIHSIMTHNYYDGIGRFFIPKSFDFSVLSEMIKSTIVKSFFSLSIGFGVTLTYGTYVKNGSNLFKLSIWVIAINTIASVCIVLLILPVLYTLHIHSYEHESIFFVILPLLFSHIPHGIVWSEIFYVILLIVAITSIASFLEVMIAVLKEKTGLDRHFVVFISCVIISFISIHIDLSHGSLALLKVKGISIYTLIPIICKQIGIPLISLFLSIYIGWVVKTDVLKEITTIGKVRIHMPFTTLWSVLIKYVVPLFCIYALLENLYIFIILKNTFKLF